MGVSHAPSRYGRAAGPSGVATARPSGQGTPTRRRYSPERRRRAAARRRRLRGFGRLVLLLVVILASVWVGTRIANATSARAERAYAAHAGDTLWSIARASYPSGQDPRRLVYLIERRNGLSSADIHPGQRLILPSPDR